VRVLLALGGNAMTNAEGRARPEDQIAAAAVAMEAVADLLQHDIEVVVTHGNGPQVGNLLVKNELAAAVVPPVPLDWCGAQTQATIGFVLMDALYGGGRHPGPGRLRRSRVHPADQADRPVPAGGRGGRARRAR
jgi:carbamate kinase